MRREPRDDGPVHGSTQSAMLALLGGLALACVLVVASGADGHSSAAPVTVVAVSGPVFSVAQDRSRIAWRACTEVVVRDLATRKQARFPIAPFPGANPPCRGQPGHGLAVAGARVVWTEATSGHKDYLSLAIGTRGGKPHGLGELVNDQYGEGDSWSDVIADGETVVQGRVRYARDEACVEANDGDRFACEAQLVGGGVWRILDRSAVRVPQVPPATLVAIAAGRIAVIAYRASGPVIEVRQLRTGALVSRAEVEGLPRAVAMSQSLVAVLVKDNGTRIVVFDQPTGEIRRTILVPGTTARALVVSDRTVVYRAGSRLWRVDAFAGRPAVAVTARTRPVSFSLEGHRLAWVETHRGTSRVRMLLLRG